jgi:O-antigen chain-terminating methyltransferase
MKSSTYAQFEDEHRGSSTAVAEKLFVYKPLLAEFKKHRPNSRLIDLGCGRGEFLKITTELSIDSLGIDTNEDMLALASQFDLKLENAEALEYLAKQEDNSFDIVTAFHLVEHFELSHLVRVTNEIKRVVRPGGLIILETPNPENIIVSTCNFYMDMTHVRPLPPQLLKFIFKDLQFNYINLWGLNSKKKPTNEPIALIDILGGVSPDYALVALQKCSEPPSKKLISELETQHGVSLNELASLYEKRWSGEVESISKTMSQGQAWVGDELKSIEKKFKDELAHYGSVIEGLNMETQDKLNLINERAHFYHDQLQSVTSSKAWRITYPIRYLSHVFRQFKSRVRDFLFEIIYLFLSHRLFQIFSDAKYAFKNLPIGVFVKSYFGKVLRKFSPKLFNNRPINSPGSKKGLMSAKEKKFLFILEKIQKEK